jgi:hypothetical protein
MKSLPGRVKSGCGDASNWPMEGILKTVGKCFSQLEHGTLNVQLESGRHSIRPDFRLLKDKRSDIGTRYEDLSFECCRFITPSGSVKALIARTSTNHHGEEVLEIMAAVRLGIATT